MSLPKSGAGLTVAPEDPGALADAVKHLRANPALSAQMGRAGGYATDHWERETVLKATEKKLASISNGNTASVAVPNAVDAG